jgi:hypothetical protein
MNTLQSAGATGVVLRPNPAAPQTPESVSAHTEGTADVRAALDRLSAVMQRALARTLTNSDAGTNRGGGDGGRCSRDSYGPNPPS